MKNIAIIFFIIMPIGWANAACPTNQDVAGNWAGRSEGVFGGEQVAGVYYIQFSVDGNWKSIGAAGVLGLPVVDAFSGKYTITKKCMVQIRKRFPDGTKIRQFMVMPNTNKMFLVAGAIDILDNGLAATHVLERSDFSPF